MLILGIETSCDDTAAALVEAKRGRFLVRKNIIASQTKLHQKYGGVVPEVAARRHLETIIPVIHEALTSPLLRGRAGVGSLDAIAVTTGPGLATSLHVGVETAKSLSLAWNVPIVGVNHIEGHIYSPMLPPPPVIRRGLGGGRVTFPRMTFPAIALIVSGGHTELILIKTHGSYKLLGRTRDDAAGEAFDKAANMLGLPYPGGPTISKYAERGNPSAFKLPRPMLERDDFEFSFSGLKNAIRLTIESIGRGVAQNASAKHDLCASIEQAIIDVLAGKSLKAVIRHKPKTFILAGGVAANLKLRTTLATLLPKNIRFLIPEPKYCMDNAAMIAAAGYYHAKSKDFDRYDTLTADANWELV